MSATLSPTNHAELEDLIGADGFVTIRMGAATVRIETGPLETVTDLGQSRSLMRFADTGHPSQIDWESRMWCEDDRWYPITDLQFTRAGDEDSAD